MEGYPAKSELDRICGEGFVFNLTECFSVHGISVLNTELSHIEMFYSLTHFFVRCKGNLDYSVFNLRVSREVAYCINYLSYTCLVISPQECRSVSSYYPVSNLLH